MKIPAFGQNFQNTKTNDKKMLFEQTTSCSNKPFALFKLNQTDLIENKDEIIINKEKKYEYELLTKVILDIMKRRNTDADTAFETIVLTSLEIIDKINKGY